MKTAVEIARSRRLALGGTFLMAVSLAVQLGHRGPFAIDQLLLTGPLVFLAGMLVGWVLSASAAVAIAAAAVAGVCTLGVAQAGVSNTDELLLLAIPLSGAAAIVTGHVRAWGGYTAIAVAVVCISLAIGVGMSEHPAPFAIAHVAALVSLPTIPLRSV